MSAFIPIPKKDNARECSNYHTTALISHTSKVMLKILQARLLQCMNHELSDVQAGFRKGRGTKDQIANIHWIIKKVKEFQKNIYFCFIEYTKDFDCVNHNKMWKILKDMRVPDHLTCLLRNLYAGQEATVRIGHETTDWFQIGKGVCQDCMLSPCLFNLYATYITWNASMDEAQAGINISARNISNLRYADDTTFMAESICYERKICYGRKKVMTNIDSIFKSRDITLSTKVHLVKAMVFPVVMYECESWTIKKADAFELCCWRRLLKVSWTARSSN